MHITVMELILISRTYKKLLIMAVYTASLFDLAIPVIMKFITTILPGKTLISCTYASCTPGPHLYCVHVHEHAFYMYIYSTCTCTNCLCASSLLSTSEFLSSQCCFLVVVLHLSVQAFLCLLPFYCCLGNRVSD